jgi:hypothetical protein
MRCPAGALAVLALTPACAQGATRYVAPHGAAGGGCTRAAPCSVAWGINGGGSAAGDTVALLPGTYADQPIDLAHELFLHGPERGGRPTFRTTGPGAGLVVEGAAAGSTLTRLALRATGAGSGADVRAASTLTNLTVATATGSCLRVGAPGVRIDSSSFTQAAASTEVCLGSDQPDSQWNDVSVSAPDSDTAAVFSGDGAVVNASFTARGTGLQLGGSPTVRRVTARGDRYGILLGAAAALVTDTVAVARKGGTAIQAGAGADELLNVTAYATGAGSDAVHAAQDERLTVKSTIALGAAEGIVADPSAVATVDHSIFLLASNVTDAGANLALAPRLADPAHGDFHLAKGSPAIDAGTYELQSGTADRGGLFRWLGRRPDIGAYEMAPPPPHHKAPPDMTAPVLRHVRLGAPVFRVSRKGVAFTAAAGAHTASMLHFWLSEHADLVGMVSRARRGASALGAFVVAERSGFHQLKLSGRLNGRPLAPGGYVLTLIARDDAQNLSPETRVAFTIIR